MNPATDPPTPAEALARVLDDECPESRLGQVLSECLSATTTTRAGTKEPDYRTRLQAASLALAYRHGLPLKREEIHTKVIGESDETLLDRLVRSPALVANLKELLAKAETIDI